MTLKLLDVVNLKLKKLQFQIGLLAFKCLVCYLYSHLNVTVNVNIFTVIVTIVTVNDTMGTVNVTMVTI